MKIIDVNEMTILKKIVPFSIELNHCEIVQSQFLRGKYFADEKMMCCFETSPIQIHPERQNSFTCLL